MEALDPNSLENFITVYGFMCDYHGTAYLADVSSVSIWVALFTHCTFNILRTLYVHILVYVCLLSGSVPAEDMEKGNIPSPQCLCSCVRVVVEFAWLYALYTCLDTCVCGVMYIYCTCRPPANCLCACNFHVWMYTCTVYAVFVLFMHLWIYWSVT